MKKSLIMMLALGLSVTTISFADDYAKCVACHGATGEKVALGKSKVIKNMTKAQIKTALNGYKSGTYGGAMKGMMVSQVSSLTATQIDAIANKIGK